MYQPRRQVLVVAATVATLALPATALALSGGTQAMAGDRPSAAAPATAGSKGFDVVGLTDKGRLVKFSSASADRSRD